MSLTPEVYGSDCVCVLQVCQPTSSVVLNCAEIEIQAATCGGQGNQDIIQWNPPNLELEKVLS